MDDMNAQFEWIGKYNSLASVMFTAWNAMPPVVDDDFPEAKYNFESAVETFCDHAFGGRKPCKIRAFQKFHGEWSEETFGVRHPSGPLKHLAKEVQEAIDTPDDVEEYADCMMLLLDAARIAGFSSDDVYEAMLAKHSKNKKREWPPVNDEGFSEHVRGGA